jgi:hypothetical protein
MDLVAGSPVGGVLGLVLVKVHGRGGRREDDG